MVMYGQPLPGQVRPQQPQAPASSSGGWDGGKPLQQQPTPGAGGAGMAGPSMHPMGGGMAGMPAVVGGGGGPSYGAISRMSAGGGGGGAAPAGPSWLSMLLGPKGPQGPQANAPAPDPAPRSSQQQMADNTAMGNQIKGENKLSHLEDGMPNSALYQGGQLVGGGYLKEGVPMAAHAGNARGPLTANGVGIPMGIGGGAGGGGAGGGMGGLAGTVQGQMDQANAANENRYTQLLKMAGMLSDSALTREHQNRDNELGQVDQAMIGAGLGNSTVLPTMERGVRDQSALRESEIGDQGLRTAMGVVERRTDQQPNYADIARLAAMPGSTGYGYGGGGGGGGGGYAGGGGGAPPAAAPPQPQRPRQPVPHGANDSMSGGTGGPSSPRALELGAAQRDADAAAIAARRQKAGGGGTPVDRGAQRVDDPTYDPTQDW